LKKGGRKGCPFFIHFKVSLLMRMLFIISILLLSHEWVLSQSIGRCATTERARAMGFQPPVFLGGHQFSRIQQTRIIPVVVHVVYQNQDQNISDRKVLSQLDVINRDFNLKNADTVLVPNIYQSLKGNVQIQFALAKTDPQGRACSGIQRIQTNVASFTFDDRVKKTIEGGSDAWPSDRYLNIWVCNMQSPVLGYSSFPGENPQNDGVVVDFMAFGKVEDRFRDFNLGRTLTHELGHYFNLYHIWGDQPGCTATDSIADTPVQNNSTTGCPQHPRVSCNNSGDLFVNFMDYTDDRCMVMFTEGQKGRMLQTVSTFRATLGTHGLDQPPLVNGPYAIISNVKQPNLFECGTIRLTIDLFNRGSDTIKALGLQSPGFAFTIDPFAFIPPGKSSQITTSSNISQRGFFSAEIALSHVNGVQVVDSFPIRFSYSSSGDTALFPKTIAKENLETEKLLNWKVNNADSLDDLTFEIGNESGFSEGEHSLLIRSFGSAIQTYGQVDELISPSIDFTNQPKAVLAFDYAYLYYNNSENNDTLIVDYSTDCGQNFNVLKKMFGSNLRTSQRSTTQDLNASRRSDWRAIGIELPELVSKVSFRIRFVNDGGGALWLDNLGIGTDLPGKPAVKFSVYPNPVKEILNINSSQAIDQVPVVSLITTSGKLLIRELTPIEQLSDSWTFKLPEIAPQLLILKIEAQGAVQYAKVMIAH
jgi:hypothetical protein